MKPGGVSCEDAMLLLLPNTLPNMLPPLRLSGLSLLLALPPLGVALGTLNPSFLELWCSLLLFSSLSCTSWRKCSFLELLFDHPSGSFCHKGIAN